MRFKFLTKRQALLAFQLTFAFVSLITVNVFPQNKVVKNRLEDGVLRFYRTGLTNEEPILLQSLKKLSKLFTISRNDLPFGKSVAFLTGVSKYRHIKPNLPFVKNDLNDMIGFLLNNGDFDTVYVAYGKIVNSNLIEDYMRNRLPKSTNKHGRLLFYFAGHGDDHKGSTGYMQFADAKPNDFAPPNTLAISTVELWSEEIHSKHILFILDCCASGLAFTRRSRGSDRDQLLATLSGNGSRHVLTAGTGDEETFEVRTTKRRGNGVFTRAFLDAVNTGDADSNKDGFMTIAEIFATIDNKIDRFIAEENQKGKRSVELNPRSLSLSDDHKGTFAFINPKADDKSINMPDEYIDFLRRGRHFKAWWKKPESWVKVIAPPAVIAAIYWLWPRDGDLPGPPGRPSSN